MASNIGGSPLDGKLAKQLMSKPKLILMVCYAFPPTGGAGVQRAVKFVKYMRNYGYEPIVLTVDNPSVPLQDRSLMQDIPDGVSVLKARTLEPSYSVKHKVVLNKKGGKRFLEKIIRNILIPDPQVFWLPGLIKKILSLRRNPPELVLVTAPPFSALLAGVIIKCILKKPLVSDFRDEWVGWLAGSSWSGIGKEKRISLAIERVMEKFVVRHSDAIIATSPGYVKGFEEKYGSLTKKRFECITNGFDTDDFNALLPEEKYTNILDKNKFNLIYMGTVWSGNSLRYFLNGIKENKIIEMMNIIIIGRITPEEEYYFNLYEKLQIQKLGYWSHEEAIKLACCADALLFTQSIAGGTERWIPAKIFEYMALRKHIIAITPKSAACDILKEYSGAIIIDPLDKEKIIIECNRLIEKWRDESIGVINDNIERHSRKVKTKELCSLFDKILNQCN